MDRTKFGLEEVHIWAYAERTLQPAPLDCRCPGPGVRPRGAPQIVLLAVGHCIELDGTFPEFWRWVSEEDLAAGFLEDPSISLWDHVVWRTDRPSVVCVEGRPDR